MRNKLQLLAISLMVSVFVLTSCSKDGEIGPQGLQGKQGVEGPAGPEGPAGEDAAQGDGSEGGTQGGGSVEGGQGEQGDQGDQGQQGEQGEQGQQGAPGEDGADGEDGQNGENGEDGNANVIDSGWLTPSFESGFMRIADPALTFERVNNSLILVFGVWQDGEDLIYQFPHEISDEKYSFYLINEGSGAPFGITLKVTDSEGSTVDEPRFCDGVKYFIVPSNSLTGKTSATDFEKMSYEEVVAHFGLE